VPLNCAYLFIAIDIPHFRSLADFKREASEGVDRIHQSKRATGTVRTTVPGERKWEARLKHTQVVPVAAAVDQALRELEAELGIGAQDDN
jgi:LDH2 family malate/lactate/ureidoglycolate dehydrogenase